MSGLPGILPALAFLMWFAHRGFGVGCESGAFDPRGLAQGLAWK